MADEEGGSRKRRATRGPEATARSEALQLLKARKSGGRRSDGAAPQIKLENPIYDTVEEDEYNALVAKRREQARSFIVDDDGLGYGDEGEEEDWSKAGFTLSDDESEGEAEKPKRKKDPPQPKRPSSSLSAAAAMMGAQRLSSMFTSSVFKKNRDDKVSDSIVDDVLAEFAPDETDRLRRRRIQPNSNLSSAANNALRIKPSADSVRGSSLNENFANANNDAETVSVVKDNGSNLGLEQKCEVEVNGNSENVEAPMVVQTNDFPCPSNEDIVEEKVVKDSELEVKPASKKEVFTLNAKVTKEEVDPKLWATVGWQAARSGAGGAVGETNVADSKDALQNQQQAEFLLEPDGSLPFYILDAYEEYYGANMGTLYLFGKVKTGNLYQSCCVVVKNMQRCVYAIPSRSLNYIDEMMKLENDVQESRISPADFRKKLQEAVSDTKNEIAKHLMDLGVSTFSMAPVKRKYAFERFDIPAGENYAVKINYPFKDPALPIDLKGESFCALLGSRCSALELFLIKRKIMGPSWLHVSKFSTCSASQRVSWCKFEVTVASPKDIRVSSTPSKITFEIPPPVVVTAINLKTIINETVKLILSKETPHFVCDSRVLVKPYKEKGKVLDKKQQQMDRGDYSPCGTPTGLDARDQYDLQLDGRMFYNTQDMLWRRKLEEQADLQQALELQSRRLMGLQLLDIKNNTNVVFLLEVQFLLQLTLLICSTKILFFLPFTEAQNLLQKKMV